MIDWYIISVERIGEMEATIERTNGVIDALVAELSRSTDEEIVIAGEAVRITL
ncbi:hypothetical protein GCM10009006_34610 [Haloarcula argentinensis]|uniref:Uncharacterized protein n=1 Tax=Haloarcula argentinensis TaxID=43776 RepID=A0A830FHH1_HALAR|nr:hypothetical protein GCM10009006_34610 [Haloarcula argentinensis]